MPPKPQQSTLGSFFKLPPGTKPPVAQQTRLKSTKKAPSGEEDEIMEGTEEAKHPKSPGSRSASVEKEEPPSTATKSKKRSSPPPAEQSDVSMEDDDVVPVKRRRRNTKLSDDEDEPMADVDANKGTKGKNNGATTKDAEKESKKKAKAVKKEASDDEELAPQPSKPATKKKAKSPSAEVKVEKASRGKTPVKEEEESDKDDSEAEKKVSSAAAKKLQKTLTTNLKHPYPDWPQGKPVPYAALVKTFTLVEATTKRLEITAHTALFLRQVLRLTPDAFLMVIHLMTNKLAADYEGIELGIGESLLMKAISESCGRSMAQIKSDQKEIGDLGEVAAKSRQNQKTLGFIKPTPLTVKTVHDTLMSIATIKGSDSQSKKVNLIKKLLANCSQAEGGAEAKYLIRGLEGKLRLGLAEKTVLTAIAQAIMSWQRENEGRKASEKDLAEAEEILRDVFCEVPSYEMIIPALLEHGFENVKNVIKLQPGVPLKPMLAKPTKSITEVLDRFEGKRFTCEFKYDGERAQIHFVSSKSKNKLISATEENVAKIQKGVAKIFSRNSEDLSKKYPDILEVLDTWIKDDVDSFVLDCEAVAWDKVEKKILPFQQLMTRKRKDVAVEDIKVKVCVFAFDLLYLNGKSVVQETLEERRRLMHESFTPIDGEFAFAVGRDANDIEQIQIFLDESIKSSCEGLMVKMLDGEESGYEPSKRSRNWLKLKKDYLNGVGDSLDLVVVGAYHGKGKRTSGYGAFMLACYNSANQTYETICNIGTGFSEAMLEELFEKLSNHEIDRPKPFYRFATSKSDQPDVWFEPAMVWEVKAADLTLSPRYRAAEGMADASDPRGVSLRFPRFLRIREDKKPDEATNSRQVAEMYRAQDSVGGSGSKGGVDDDFDY